MDSYRTEEEQVEAIKRWWADNGKGTVAAIVVGVAVTFGWRAWQDHQVQVAEQASDLYQQVLDISSSESGDITAQQKQTVASLIERLRVEYSDSAYAQLAALMAAKLSMDDADLATAREQLEWVAAQQPDASIAPLVQLRLARVMLAQGEHDAALAKVAATTAADYAAPFAELRGDIYLAQGNEAAALEQFEQAQSLYQSNPMLRPGALLDVKIQSLAHLKATEDQAS